MCFIVSKERKTAFALSAEGNLNFTYPFPGITILATRKEQPTPDRIGKDPEPVIWRLPPSPVLGQSHRPGFSLRRRSCTYAQISGLLSPRAVTLIGLETTRQLRESFSLPSRFLHSFSPPGKLILIRIIFHQALPKAALLRGWHLGHFILLISHFPFQLNFLHSRHPTSKILSKRSLPKGISSFAV
jgi:hypothetical protein